MALWCCVITLLFGGIICHMWAPETSGRGKKVAPPTKGNSVWPWSRPLRIAHFIKNAL